MKSLRNLLLIVMASLFFSPAALAMCKPKFLNPITGVCWTCMFPITVFGHEITPDGVDKKASTSSSGNDFFCACKDKIGTPVGFWEPVRSVDVVKEPFCFLNLGFQIDTDAGGSTLPFDIEGGVETINSGDNLNSIKKSFYHVHYYTNPMLYWLELLLDDPCIEKGEFDLGYLTEADPTWGDPQLAGILNPDAFLYGNIVAVAACTADCVASTTKGFPIDVMHWCSGCQGTVYPLTGQFNYHRDGVSTSSVMMQRMLTKSHRVGSSLAYGSSGPEAYCGYYPQFMIRKSAYKFQLTHPFPQDKRFTGSCCQTLGTSSQLFGMGKNIPVVGEDFGYLIFRKRDCCSAVISAETFSGNSGGAVE